MRCLDDGDGTLEVSHHSDRRWADSVVQMIDVDRRDRCCSQLHLDIRGHFTGRGVGHLYMCREALDFGGILHGGRWWKLNLAHRPQSGARGLRVLEQPTTRMRKECIGHEFAVHVWGDRVDTRQDG
eukprot:scaffold195499_cov31-Tisochrysis_lutea.AAC.4